MSRSPDPGFVGAWRLRTWVALADDGSEATAMGEAPHGLLVYSADGTMLTAIGPADRGRFGSNDVAGGTDEERILAFDTFFAYGGSYSIEGDAVTHRVETSLFPNWVGTEQRRRWELSPDGSILTLSSPPLGYGGASRIQRLTWERRSG
ncbi:MAG: lipocalin-like domain-containing protein [Candidatus Limnocylindrales bacterium]